MADEKYHVWVADQVHVDAKWANGGGIHGSGRVYGYAAEPTLMIERADGSRFSWLARLCEPSDPPTTEQEGVSPATAGGASAPDRFRTGNHNPGHVYEGDDEIGFGYTHDWGRRFVKALNAYEGGNDPRDAEIRQLRGQVDDLAGRLADACTQRDNQQAEVALRQRDLLAEMDEHQTAQALLADAREEWKRADAEVTRQRKELDEIRHRLAVELNLKPSELDGRETSDLAVELGDRRRQSVIYWKGLAERRKRELDQHLADENSAQAANDRLRDEFAQIANLVGVPSAGRPETVRAAVERYLFELDQRRGERDEARAERESLRAKAELASDREKLAAERDVMAAALISMQQILNAADEKLAMKPAEPRRWVAGDPEPEVGTTVTWGAGVNHWKRGVTGWTSASCSCNQCRSMLGLTWNDLLAYAPLVEVVSTDG